MRPRRTDAQGFTLVEMLVALSILGLTLTLGATLFASGLDLRRTTRERLSFEREARQFLTSLQNDLAHLVPAGPLPD